MQISELRKQLAGKSLQKNLISVRYKKNSFLFWIHININGYTVKNGVVGRMFDYNTPSLALPALGFLHRNGSAVMSVGHVSL